MNLDVENLPEDPSELKEIIATQSKNYQDKIEHLEQYIRLLKNEIFGSKSEKRPRPDDKQVPLFDEFETIVDETAEAKEEEKVAVPAHSRAKRGRKPLPADLPREDIVHDISDAEKNCTCGARCECIGQEVSEKLVYVPAELKVERHIRLKYACRECEGVEDDGPTVKIAPVPAQLIPKGVATSGLVAQIVTSKFEDALPLYRQEKIFSRLGIDLSRATMAGWMIKVADRAGPILQLFENEIRSGPFVNIDETPVQVLNEPDRPNTSKSYMWIFRGGDPDHPSLVYRYHPSRAGQVPLQFLNDYKGFVQTDGYNGYEALGRQSGITLVGCWYHARRKFSAVIKAKAHPNKQHNAEKALDYIGQLYAIEKQARKQQLNAEQIRELRQQKAQPVLDEFKDWLDQTIVTTPPKGLLGKAVNYTLKFWKRLIRYVDDGRLRPDNNLAENAIRPFVVGRKNWLFSAHPNGAAASAALYSIIETAKANELKPYFYLRYLFDNLPFAQTEADFKNLLPQYVDSAALADAAPR